MLQASAVGVAGLLVAGCSKQKAEPFAGELIEPPYGKPDVMLTTVNGEPFPLRKATDGKLTLLYLGYTHCPDQCPVWLNTVARAREAIGSGPGSRPQVLFVGVDLKRDTPLVLKQYLGRIDSTFIGLTGTEKEIVRLNDALHFPPLIVGKPDANGDYEVGHYARAVAYSPDNKGHRFYGFDTRHQQLVADLPRLAQGQWK